MKSIAVAILNWNGRELLERFLPSVTEHSAQGDIIVIDNASTDKSIGFLKSNYPGIRIIELERNTGYAGGYYEGLKQIENDYIVLLNSDIETAPNWLDPILRAFESDPQVSAVQPKILSLNQRTHFEYAGAAGGYIDRFGYTFCRGRLFDLCEEDRGQYDDTQEVFWATGACLAVRRSAYIAAGELNPRFFAHMEEVDLCWRMKRMGGKVLVTPESRVYHLGGGTLAVQSANKTFLNFRNNLLLLTSNLPMSQLPFIILIRLFLDGIAGLKYLVERKPEHTWAVIRAHFAYYGMMGEFLQSRKGPFPWPLTGVYQKSTVMDVFVHRLRTYSELDSSAFFKSETGR